MPLIKNLLALLQRRKLEQGLSDEFRFHLEKQIELNLAAGMNTEEARRQALITFGGIQQTRESVHRQYWTHTLETLLQDIHYAVRLLRKSPGFAAIAISILALGIGANTAIFTAVNTVLFARWPVRHQEQLMLVREPSATNQGFLISIPNFDDYRHQQTTFQQMSLWLGQTINLTGREHPERLVGGFVSDNFFGMLGVNVARGRTFLPDDDRPGAAPVAVISDEAWHTRFGSDPALLGSRLTLNNELYTIVGILPPGFSLPVSPSEVFVPARHFQDYKVERYAKSFLVFGRMQDGVTRKQATADLNNIAQRLAHDYPNENAGIHTELTGLQDLTTEKVRTPLLVLLGAVLAILLIVCANVANLLMARGATRQHEVEVRAALGASRGHLIRQFLCESLLLSTSGGIGGIFLARILLRLLQTISPVDVDISATAALDGRILLFTTAVSLLTGLLFGMAPAFQFSRVNLSSTLAGAGRITGNQAHERLRSGFVVCQLAMSLSLVVSAGLLARSFNALAEINPGFTPGHLLTMEYRLPISKYQTSDARWNFHRQMRDQVSRAPGVVSAAIVQGLPLSGNWGQISFDLPGKTTPREGIAPTTLSNAVTPEYFSTLEIPLLKGRGFNSHDGGNAAPVVIISQAFAQKYFSNRDPLGQEIRISDTEETTIGNQNSKRATVIGIVGSAKQRALREIFEPQIYFSYAQVTGNFGTLVVRTAEPPENLVEPIRQAIWSVDKDQPVWRIRTMDSLIAKDLAPGRFAMLLMSAFGALALLLSALGTYAMLSYAVSQRTRELGIRIALGADRRSLLKLVLSQGTRLMAAGGLLGLLGAFISARLLGSMLYLINPIDITTFFCSLCVMALIAMLASYLPARRATRVDPVIALRNDR